ncbi:helix-turn-helix transcriptional regulator [Mesorhizobium sp. WSM4313]|uniref:helix-turn-helix domain-containing protein n=1 Tax=Mesorhizobium sp. WSM4313 TaxID=2029412 RepID=UPI000BB0BD57|nr:helix-turn-helix transcriptional regulator [Mesorhizobium sp. WSM4313]PBB20327.1 hypothetical protein CK219_10130 [Mesorhizobium sp. WSM4313]
MPIPTNVLRKAREEAGVKQSELAKALGVSPSVVSRLEKTDETEDAMARRYLGAIGTQVGDAIIDFYQRDWTFSERPSFYHPDKDILWDCELSLKKLASLENDENYDHLLDLPIQKTRGSIIVSSEYIFRLDHTIAWIGPIGVGKTTALSHLTGLIIDGSSGKQPVFPATGGRTTICEVVIRPAPAFGVAVEPMTEDAVRLLVRDMVRGISLGEGGLTTEMDRAVRNMADVKRPKGVIVDPVSLILEENNGAVDEAVEQIILRMNLKQRTETQIILSETNEKGLRWVSENVTKINYGQHPGFSLPSKITVFVPESYFRNSEYNLSIVDTKGIIGTSQRNDLRDYIDDPRTLSVLCSGFNDAPGADTTRILSDLKATGSDAIERQRISILILARSDEAMKVIDDSGDLPDTAQEGYAIREDQARKSLTDEGASGVPIGFFNALTDSASEAWARLDNQIGLIRQRQVDRLKRSVELAEALVSNPDVAKIEQARASIDEEIGRIIAAYSKLVPLIRPAQQNLIQELERGHPSSIAASVVRRGAWDNFSVDHIIGVGVRVDANLRTKDVFLKIHGRLEALEQKFSSLPEVVAIVTNIRDDLNEWRQEFLTRALSIGRVAYKAVLDTEPDLWERLATHWGQGPGYRNRVIADVKKWFEETTKLAAVRTTVERRLSEAWQDAVLSRLGEALKEHDPEE